ncbi:MAG: CoA transferase [Propionibacteriales bacterium]|nr:CoA transferase [Propionibacteriales bacterium]
MSPDGLKHIYDGIRVLDFTQVLAGPTVTRLLAEMGADVIKVELPPGGDRSRALPYLRDGRSGYHIQQNRGKRSLCVDLHSARGIEIVFDLLRHVDIVVDSFSPGTLGALGLTYDAMKAVRPGLIMCSVSAFGQDGELAGKPGYDHIAQAYSGITSMIGTPEAAPSLTSFGVGDVTTGVYGMAAVASALFHRERTGEGQWVEVSLLDTYFNSHEINVQAYSGSRGDIKPSRSGSHHYAICPFGVYRTSDGFVFIAVPSEHQWSYLCRAIGREELIEDPRYSTNRARSERATEVVEIVEGWLATLSGTEEAVRVLEAERVPVAPVLSVEQAIHHPHLRQRRTVRSVRDRVWGTIEIPGVPMRFSAWPDELPLEAPFLGEHNEEILSEYLGYDAQTCESLAKGGVLASESHKGKTGSSA